MTFKKGDYVRCTWKTASEKEKTFYGTVTEVRAEKIRFKYCHTSSGRNSFSMEVKNIWRPIACFTAAERPREYTEPGQLVGTYVSALSARYRDTGDN